MQGRFTVNAFVLVDGMLLAVTRWLFGPPAMPWLVFGLGGLVLVVAVLAFPLRGRGRAQRWLDVAMAIVSGWVAVSAITYTSRTVGWLALGAGSALAVLALGGLAVHEQRMERAARAQAAAAEQRNGAGGDGRWSAPLSAPRTSSTS